MRPQTTQISIVTSRVCLWFQTTPTTTQTTQTTVVNNDPQEFLVATGLDDRIGNSGDGNRVWRSACKGAGPS